MMDEKSNVTFFAEYVPDPFIYTSHTNILYQSLLEVSPIVETKKGRAFFGLRKLNGIFKKSNKRPIGEQEDALEEIKENL